MIRLFLLNYSQSYNYEKIPYSLNGVAHDNVSGITFPKRNGSTSQVR